MNAYVARSLARVRTTISKLHIELWGARDGSFSPSDMSELQGTPEMKGIWGCTSTAVNQESPFPEPPRRFRFMGGIKVSSCCSISQTWSVHLGHIFMRTESGA